jgi:hypothetical protein
MRSSEEAEAIRLNPFEAEGDAPRPIQPAAVEAGDLRLTRRVVEVVEAWCRPEEPWKGAGVCPPRAVATGLSRLRNFCPCRPASTRPQVDTFGGRQVDLPHAGQRRSLRA